MRVLIADDDRDVAATLALFLEECGHEVGVVTTGGLDVIHFYSRFQPDAVIMDVMMPRFNGITTSHALLSKDPKARLILMSGKLSGEHPFIATSGAARFVAKPLHLDEIKALLESFESPAAA